LFGLSLINFNKYLDEISDGTLKIIKGQNVFKLIENSNQEIRFQQNITKSKNTIYYGAPGTGKSHKVDSIIKELDPKFYERVTFHPEFDNASFVGGYKPVSEEVDGNEVIKYKFVPQAFANIYSRAWKDLENPYYLVIEEINRGNCAEIFGEIFQLLDRNSNYSVTPSKELKEHLIKEFEDNIQHDGIVKGLKLPSNLHILATMNTSDQSLYPMDSAFKRRPPALYSKTKTTQNLSANNDKEMEKIVNELKTLKVKRDQNSLKKEDSLRIDYLFNQYQKLKNGH
jgi:5-methylcytosine-specific restriction endonuclease McrBC GTP-binding regulatory subunit McrB